MTGIGRDAHGPHCRALIREAWAERHGTVLLNGSGFHGPPWSARVSLANLDDAAYAQIGRNLSAVVKGAVEKWEKAGRPVE